MDPEFLTDTTAEFAMTKPQDCSLDLQENRVIFQTKMVALDIAALSRAFDDVTFHIAGLDDPRIVVPLGANVTIDFENQDGAAPHGWRLIQPHPPFAHPREASTLPLAFPGSEIEPRPPHGTAQATFIADQPGLYTYLCPVASDNRTGLYGEWEVVPGH